MINDLTEDEKRFLKNKEKQYYDNFKKLLHTDARHQCRLELRDQVWMLQIEVERLKKHKHVNNCQMMRLSC